MPDWLDGLIGAGTDIFGTAVNGQVAIATAQANAATVASQQQAMAGLAAQSQILGSAQTSKFMIYGVGILLFVLVLRQTSQNR